MYQKINNYLLRNVPSVWITRVHFFLPVALLIIAVFFSLNAFVVNYNLNDDLPSSAWAVVLSIIPVLIFLVFWFVIQARYNVEKSGGKLTLFQEYTNYFIYFLIFLFSFGIVLAFPVSTDYKVYHSVDSLELNQDIKNLNLGNTVVNTEGSLEQRDNRFVFTQRDYVIKSYYIYDDYDNGYTENKQINVSKTELKEIINNYIQSYNKYTHEKVYLSASEIIQKNLNNESNYNEYQYSDYYYQPVSSKLYRIKNLHNNGWYEWLIFDEGFYVFMIFIVMLALMVWMFKQIHWKYFVFGLVALLLTPLFATIFALIFYEIFRLSDDEFVFRFILFLYGICALIVGYGLNSKSVNHASVVVAFYLQFFIPFLPLFAYLAVDERIDNDHWEIIFWVGFILAILSVAVFKYIYRKMRLLPLKK
jgi:hypothetical protein